jgi:RNA polymerase sigma-70 factor (ECF subfamily)
VAVPADVASADDRALMLGFQDSGHLGAFEELFRRHRLPLFRYLRGLARSADIAEEVSQHTWLKVIEAARATKYDASAQSSFKTWLYTLARNHYIDHYLRSHARCRTDSNADEHLLNAVDDSETPESVLDREQLGGKLERAIAQLPLEQREVVLLWTQGHDLSAIALIARVPWETIVSRKKYALTKLRAALATTGLVQGDV